MAGSGGVVFHVLNRAVRRARLFDHDDDYRALLRLVGSTLSKVPIELFAYCIMPNHFHLVVRPERDGDLSNYMRLMTLTHSKRWHEARGTTGTGCVYQGRFKAFPIQTDSHFLTVCRYVERNPLRARLSARAEEWPWSSLSESPRNDCRVKLSPWPVDRPSDWQTRVNDPESFLTAVRASVVRSRPFGAPDWVEAMALHHGLESSLREPNRPGASDG